MRMNLAMARINHKPLVVGIILQNLQQPLPFSLVPPSTEAAVDVLPIAKVGRQVAPWRAGAQYTDNRVDKQPVIAGVPAPCALATHKVRLYERPCLIGYVMPSVCLFHSGSSHYAMNLPYAAAKSKSIDDTA
jgi:hypothetical protein